MPSTIEKSPSNTNTTEVEAPIKPEVARVSSESGAVNEIETETKSSPENEASFNTLDAEIVETAATGGDLAGWQVR